jgi:hypothetical protein
MQIWFAQGRNPVTALIASQRSRSEAAETLEVPITSGPVFLILMLGPFVTPGE